MPGCDTMTGMNTPSGLKARTITVHGVPTPQTPKAMTNNMDKNQYLPTWSTPTSSGESEGPVGLPFPRLPPVGIHKEEHLLFLFIEVYQCAKNKKKCD